MPDKKTKQARCLGGFSVMWVPKILLSPVKIRIFCPKTTQLCPKIAFWSFWARPCRQFARAQSAAPTFSRDPICRCTKKCRHMPTCNADFLADGLTKGPSYSMRSSQTLKSAQTGRDRSKDTKGFIKGHRGLSGPKNTYDSFPSKMT